MCNIAMHVDSSIDLSVTDGNISRSLPEDFLPCLESTPNVQRSKRNPEKGIYFCLFQLFTRGST